MPSNQSKTVILFINAAHFIDHYAMLIFAAAVLVMAPQFNMRYSELLPFATPGFIAFGAGSTVTGWFGDKWSRRHMMLIFFIGMGLALIGVTLCTTPLQLSFALLAVGLVASIYHPVGMAMIASHTDQIGKTLGINGVWGNLGVASSALVTGFICEYSGWQMAFLCPALACMVTGLLFAKFVHHETVQAGATKSVVARIPKDEMKLVVVALVLTIIASSTTFNAVTVAIPKLFQERLSEITTSTTTLGVIACFVYVFGALAQYVIGKFLDTHSLKRVFVPVSLILVPTLFLSAYLSSYLLITVCTIVIIGIFGQVTINDTMIAKYTSDEWRGRAYSARYFLGFTAAGASVSLVSLLYASGGFELMLKSFSALCALIIVAAYLFPDDTKHTGAQAA